MQKYTLYTLCDYAQIFVHQLHKFENLPQIPVDEIEALIVVYLNHCGYCYNVPLSLYRSDLNDKGFIMNNKSVLNLNSEIKRLFNFNDKFIATNFNKLINVKYSVNAELSKSVDLNVNDVKKILEIFISSFKEYCT